MNEVWYQSALLRLGLSVPAIANRCSFVSLLVFFMCFCLFVLYSFLQLLLCLSRRKYVNYFVSLCVSL